MDEGKVTVFCRRLCIMIMALIAPELIITWAASQFLSARDTAKDFNDAFGMQLHQARSDHPDIGESAATLLGEIPSSDGRNSPHPSAPHVAGREFKDWTATHGFFTWMGGFMLYFDDKSRATLRPDELLRFVREESVDVPVIMEADIADRSKGDALSKGIAILQLAWFVVQLVARYVQNLPITLLEIDTLAVAALTCITYGFWWKKPKDVGRPHAIYWKATASRPRKLAYDKINSMFSRQDCSHYFTSCVYPILTLMGAATFNSPRAVRSRRVPSVGGYDEDGAGRHRTTTLLIGCCSGVVFGAIHCLGWNDVFQGNTEQLLWRVASLEIVLTPVGIMMLSYFIWGNDSDGEVSASVFLVIGALIYIVARVTLIVLLLMSLRSLPPGVYDTVAWT
ncbi:hypothetical protein EDB19DRAFT_1850904, partial [Suillus lakei]